MLKKIKAIIQAIKLRLCRRELKPTQYGNGYEELAAALIRFARVAAELAPISYAEAHAAAVLEAHAMAQAGQTTTNIIENFFKKLDELAEPPSREEHEDCNKTTHKKRYTAAEVVQVVMYYKKPVRYTSGVPPNVWGRKRVNSIYTVFQRRDN